MALSEHLWRARIFSPIQHPLSHSFSEVGFVHPSLPGISNAEEAINYILAVLYPNTKESVASPAELPTSTVYKVCTFTTGVPGVVNCVSHGLSNGDPIAVRSTGTLPSPLIDAKVYFVSNKTDDSFELSVTSGGSSITLSGTPTGTANIGNVANDYRIVTNDGDGSGASYRWEKREGEVVYSWHKVYDMDWGEDSILSSFLEVTQDLYVFKYGMDDRDSSGNFVAGLYAGQRFFGGSSAGTNLTLSANSGDGTGAATGYVQVTDNFRPTVDSTYSLGTTGERWLKIWTDEITSGTLTALGGSITDSSGAISFGDENLSTTGTITAVTVYATTGIEVGALLGNALILGAGSITDESGAISFGNENLSTTGNVTAVTGYFTTSVEVGALLGNALILGAGSITDESGAISFSDENLSTTGTITATTMYATTGIEVGALLGNALLLAAGSIKDESGAISFDNENLSTSGTLGAGATTVTSLDCDDLYLDGQTISTDNSNKNIILDPHGTGLVEIGSGIFPTTDSTDDIGKVNFVWNKLWIDGAIGNSSNEILLNELLSLRNLKFRDAARTQAVQAGDVLFWDSVSGTWLASSPDTEIDHGSLFGLGDDDHTQYVLLAGRAGGQTIQGGTAASNTLVLESTANATKGTIQFKDNLVPFTNASYSGGWSGTDLGDATHYINNVYSKGEFKGFRVENFTAGTIPASSAQNVGRLVYTTDTKKVYVDNGTAFISAGSSKFVSDTVWNGSDTTKDVDVSSSITDARNCVIQLMDNTNDYELVICSIKATSASNVRITAVPALTAGSYRLIVLE